MTTAEAKRLCLVLVIPFFALTILFLGLRDILPRRGAGAAPEGEVTTATVSARAPGGAGRLGAGAYSLRIPDSYWDAPESPAPDNSSAIIERETVRLANEVRELGGLTQLAADSTASDVARAYARAVAEGDATPNYYATNPALARDVRRGRTDLIAGVGTCEFFLESQGQIPPELVAGEAVASWVNSATHRSTLMCEPCEEIGVGAWLAGDRVCVVGVVLDHLIRFEPELPVSVAGDAALHVEGEFLSQVSTQDVAVSVAVPPAFWDLRRRLGYKPMKEEDVPIVWQGSRKFSVDLPCQSRGLYVLHISEGSRRYPDHIFRVE
jgi:uncharacterized protein YkwD